MINKPFEASNTEIDPWNLFTHLPTLGSNLQPILTLPNTSYVL